MKKTPGTGLAMPDTDTPARVLKRVERKDPHEFAKMRGCAGNYRIIHGQIIIPRDRELTHNADGTRKENVELLEYLKPGDTVWLNDFDASSALDNQMVEPVDVAVSRVGRVFEEALEAWRNDSRHKVALWNGGALPTHFIPGQGKRT
jgi:hypothetical protein